MNRLARKVRELRREVQRLQRRAVQRTRRVVLRGQFNQARRQEVKAVAVAKRVMGLETALGMK